MKRVFPLLLLAVAAPSPAQMVFKCVDGGGYASYQSEPCPGDARQAKAWQVHADSQFTPERIAADREIATKSAALGRHPPRSGRSSHHRRAAVRVAGERSKCEAAKRHRENTLDKVGLKRDFDLLRKLDDDVWRACK